MVRVERKYGNSKVAKVELEKDGQWRYKFVHSMRFGGDVVHVESEWENTLYLWGDQYPNSISHYL